MEGPSWPKMVHAWLAQVWALGERRTRSRGGQEGEGTEGGKCRERETKEEPTQEALPMEGCPIGWWWGAWPPQLPVCPPPVRPLPDREPVAQ